MRLDYISVLYATFKVYEDMREASLDLWGEDADPRLASLARTATIGSIYNSIIASKESAPTLSNAGAGGLQDTTAAQDGESLCAARWWLEEGERNRS